MKYFPKSWLIIWFLIALLGFVLVGWPGVFLTIISMVSMVIFEYFQHKTIYKNQKKNNSLSSSASTSEILETFNLTGNKINDQLKLAENETSQTRTLISDGVQDLSHSFHELNSAVSNQHSLLHGTFEGKSHDMVDSFVKETEVLLNYFVESVISTSKDSVYLMHCIDDMGSRIESVLKLLDSISNVAADINLLSLNASIEAARAGEAGRGFSVVAQEVRNLSNKSDQVSSDINKISKEVIDTLQVVKKVVDRIASADMSIAIKSKEKVIEMSDFVRSQNDKTKDVLDQTSQLSQLISNATNKAVMSLQFEDMCRQLLEHVEKRLTALQELTDILCSSTTTLKNFDTAKHADFNSQIETIEQKLAKIAPHINSTQHNSVSQTNMNAGDVELF